MKTRLLDFSSDDQEPPDPPPGPPETIDPGWYVVQIVEVEEKKQTVSGTWYYLWSLFPTLPTVHDDFRLHVPTVVSDKGIWKLAELISAAMSCDKPTGTVEFDPGALLGKKLLVRVGRGRYSTSDGWKDVNTIGEMKPLPDPTQEAIS